MSIVQLNVYIAVIALILSFLMRYKSEKFHSLWDSFLQNFCGALFIFSGFVKAVDPMGTAFKMEEYFKEFELTARGSFLSFMADLFPFLLKYALGFSVFMIVLEIIVGIALILGFRKKWTAWTFFLIMVFFTILTGYTYLTGYVPSGTNFFEFSKWGTWDKSLMRVQNCGCFGDFIKLEPSTSFLKDIFLMIPALIFLFRWNKWHELFSPVLRTGIMTISTVGLILFSLSNYLWNEPMIDFRPFANGVDVKGIKEKEQEAMANVEIVAWKLRNKSTNEIKDVPDKEYMANLSSYPKAEWEVMDQVKSEPAIPITKISDFVIYDLEGSEVTDEILGEPRSRLMISCPKIYFDSRSAMVSRQDTVFQNDTIWNDASKDSFQIQNKIVEIKTVEEKKNVYTWKEDYIKVLKNKILPLVDSLKTDKVEAFMVVGGAGEEALRALQKDLGLHFPLYTSDDIILKTIMRSNPGLILWRNGRIIHKWHHARLPAPNELRRDFLDWDAPLIH